MDDATIRERLAGYRSSREEWLKRRREALARAEECMAQVNACSGAVEALESLLPAVPVSDIVAAAGGEVV